MIIFMREYRIYLPNLKELMFFKNGEMITHKKLKKTKKIRNYAKIFDPILHYYDIGQVIYDESMKDFDFKIKMNGDT